MKKNIKVDANEIPETVDVEAMETLEETADAENTADLTDDLADIVTDAADIQAATDGRAAAESAQETGTDSSQTSQMQAALSELTNDLQRTRADFENYRKQVEAQKAQAIAAAKLGTVLKFLPLVDDFERAIDTYETELKPLRKNFEKTLQSLGLQKIDSAPGTEFNPDLHEAVSIEDGDGETEVIAETLRAGYLYDGSVLRAAMVKVTRQ